MAQINIDCKSSAQGQEYKPFGYACWWHKNLPSTLKLRIGPVSNPDPSTFNCYNFPTEVVETSMSRVNPCDWQNGVIVWVNSSYQLPLTFFVATFDKIFLSNPNLINIGTVFQFSGSPTPTGSCTYDEQSGITRLTASGIAEFENPFSPQPCRLPYTVYYESV